MKHHGGLLIADGIVLLIMLLGKLDDGILLTGTNVDGISHEHQSPLFPRLRLIAHELVVIVIGEIGREPFHPIAAIDAVKHAVSDPRMHDLMAERVGLGIVPFDDSAPQEGKGRHAESAGKEIFDDGKLRKRIGTEQRDVRIEVSRRRVQILIS